MALQADARAFALNSAETTNCDISTSRPTHLARTRVSDCYVHTEGLMGLRTRQHAGFGCAVGAACPAPLWGGKIDNLGKAILMPV